MHDQQLARGHPAARTFGEDTWGPLHIWIDERTFDAWRRPIAEPRSPREDEEEQPAEELDS